MAIFVTIEDQNGEALANAFETGRVHRHFKSLEGSSCLKFISETEDSSFNQEQVPVLIHELELVRAKDLKKEESEEIERLISYCGKAKDKPGRYVKFYGERVEE